MTSPIDPIRDAIKLRQEASDRRVRALFGLPDPPAADDESADVTTTHTNAGVGSGQQAAPAPLTLDEWVRLQIARARERGRLNF
jgi:hypothetical protein